jgi:hypothetical protein
MGSQYNITNQERIQPILGLLDFNNPPTATVLPCMVSPNQTGSLQPGQIVKLDPAITTPAGGILQVIAAVDTDTPFGIIIYNTRQNLTATPGIIYVACPGAGGNPILWHVAGAAITPGQSLQYDTNGNIDMIPLAAGVAIAKALDVAASGQLFRIALTA